MSKAKKPAKAKVHDVTAPGKSTEPATSKPIIVTNRSIIRDPMMAEENPTALPVSSTPKKDSSKKIEPLEAQTAPLLNIPGLPAEVTGEEPAAPKTKKAPKPPKKPAPASKTPVDEPETKPLKADKPDTDGQEPEAKPDKNKLADAPKLPVEMPKPKSEADVKPPQEPEAPAPKNNQDDEKEETLPGPAPLDINEAQDKSEKPAAKPTEAKPAEKAAKPTKSDAHIEKLIEDKTYFLPINSVEKRRARRFVVLGILLSLVLVVAWVDVALDAGLIKLGNVKPVTHFFSS
jgi:hypothetical protein